MNSFDGSKGERYIRVSRSEGLADVAYVGRHDMPSMGEAEDRAADQAAWVEMAQQRHDQLIARRRFLGKHAAKSHGIQFPVRQPLSIS